MTPHTRRCRTERPNNTRNLRVTDRSTLRDNDRYNTAIIGDLDRLRNHKYRVGFVGGETKKKKFKSNFG